MQPMIAYWWVLIPIVAILSKTARSWMVFQAKQRQLGASTKELEEEVAALAKARAELTERIQNLETIVVSQTWGALHDRGLSPAERELKVATVAHREMGPPADSEIAGANQHRAEQLARRLQ
jgi:hypothetical protein